MPKEYLKFLFAIGALALILFISVLESLSVGVVDISWKQIMEICLAALRGQYIDATVYDIVIDLRLPRILMAVVCGGSLALGGVVMQAVIKNPLADPYVLGISSGAALGATSAILLGAFSYFGAYGVSAGAFIGALTVAFFAFVITFTSAGGHSSTKLVLAGTALNAVCGAGTSMIVYLAKDAEGMRDAAFWIMGSMARVTWDALPLCSIIFVTLSFYFIYQFRTLNASLLGEEMAVILGIELQGKRKIFLVMVAALVSAVVAAVGVIGFVGLVIPHIVRLVYGNNHLKLLPISILVGAIYIVWCDIFARILLANAEVPIGVLTSLVGGPFFLYLMLKKKYGYGDE